MEETKQKVTLPIKTLARNIADYRYQERFYAELKKKHGELMMLAYSFGRHPDIIFKALNDIDEALKK